MSQKQVTPLAKPRCYELSNVVWYEGGDITRHAGRQVRVNRVYPDGDTIDLTWINNGVEYDHIAVSHTSKLKDVSNPLSPEAVRLRGLWATVQEHAKLRDRDESERIERVRSAEQAREEFAQRQQLVREKVLVESRKEGADFAQIADNFGVSEADVRDWTLAPVTS
jgi:hypothetical protein